MKVIALKSFVSRMAGRMYRPAVGDVLEMPEGADWLRVGLVASGELASGAAAIVDDGDGSGGIAGDGDVVEGLNTDEGNTDGDEGAAEVSPDVAGVAMKKKGKK